MAQHLTWPTLTDLNHDEPFQELCQSRFTINLDKCDGKSNNPDD